MQKAWADDPKYLDVEGSIYHYPSRYFSAIDGFERFIYYRPSKGALRAEASRYIGYGELGSWFPDVHTSAGVYGDPFADLIDVDEFYLQPSSSLLIAKPPTQPFREITSIPDGTGYRPSGKAYADVTESASLQERARADHQATLQALQKLVHRRGGTTLYNNNVDLFARVGEERYLIEAKSLVDVRASVDRMRYGLGQLLDYGVRYRSELEGATPILAFGRIPDRETSWISTILNENGVAFVGMKNASTAIPLNARAEVLPLFA